MESKLIVRQNSFMDCGPSCLLSVMKYYGLEASHEEVSYILKTDSNGTNALNIIKGSRSFGFDGYGIHYSYDEIINNKISFPIICHVQKNNMYHFIVIYKVTKKYLIVMDPASNSYKMTFEEFKKIYLNTAIIIYPIKNIQKCDNQYKLKQFIFDYLKLEKRTCIKTLILSILTIIFNIIINYYTLICIDIILPKYNINILIKVSIIFLNIYLFKNIISYIKDKYIINLDKDMSIKLNKDIIIKLFNLPYQFFKSKSTGEVVNRINDIRTFKNLLIEIISNISINVILIIISMIILLYINVNLFLINLFGIFIYYLIVILFKNTFNIKTQNVLESDGEYNKILNESICSYETNRNLNMLNDSIKNIEIKNISYVNRVYSYEKIINIQNLLKDIIVSFSYIFSIYLSIKYINDGIITIGEFMLFNSILYYFNEPIKNILDLEPNIDYIKNIYNRVNDLFIMRKDEEGIYVNNLKGDIIFKNLSYSHDGLNNILNNINFSIKYGSKFLIYGNSGNGKSTLIKILLKYLNNYDGDILINNINLKDISSNSIMNNMTYVSQNNFIYNDTLKNNIICNRNIDIEEYEKVINICNLDKLRNNSKLRNNFIIEDNGFNVSGGERQKILLARSLLKKSNYLILDEALSEVGLDEEKEIINKIFEYFKDKTIIYISHKKEIIDLFDLKFKLERGKRSC